MADGLIAVAKVDNQTGLASVSISNIHDSNSVKSINYELLTFNSGIVVKSGDAQYAESSDSIDLKELSLQIHSMLIMENIDSSSTLMILLAILQH